MYPDKFMSIALGYESDVAQRFADLRARQAQPDSGPASDAERMGLPVKVQGSVAIIPVMGIITRRAGKYASLYGITGSESVRMAVEAADKDPDVQQILLRIDSPGGAVSGLAELADAIRGTSTPVTAQVEGLAASAAYYIASQADSVVAGRGDLIGSIGTILMMYDYSKAFEKDGVEAVPITTGKHKAAGAVGTEITEEQRAELQKMVDTMQDDFVAAIVRGRGMSEEAVREVGDGRIFSTAEALELGLIDGVATLRETLTALHSKEKRKTQSARARLRI